MKTVAIIQTRMGSTRLPGKVLMDLGGDTVLSRVVRRVRRAKVVQDVLVATTTFPSDSAIVEECNRLGVPSFRGSEADVLDRYYRAAQACAADAVVRVTSDCPVIDPELVDSTVAVFLGQHADYASNVSPRRYPRGLDTEVFSMTALERAWRDSSEPHQREHVTPYFSEHPELFRLASSPGTSDYSQYRWTLDTSDDLALLRAIYEAFENKPDFGWRDVLALMQRRPELADLNSGVVQKSSRAGQ